MEHSDLALLRAAGDGDLEGVRYWLGRGAAPANFAEETETPLHRASNGGHLELLDYWCNPEALNEEIENALNLAAAGGHLDVCRELVDAGLDPSGDDGWRTPLMDAASEGHLDVTAFLLWEGADASYLDSAGDCALSYAAHRPEAAKLLLDHDKDPETGVPKVFAKKPTDYNAFEQSPVVVIAEEGGIATLGVFFDNGFRETGEWMRDDVMSEEGRVNILEAEERYRAKWRSILILESLGTPGLIIQQVAEAIRAPPSD